MIAESHLGAVGNDKIMIRIKIITNRGLKVHKEFFLFFPVIGT